MPCPYQGGQRPGVLACLQWKSGGQQMITARPRFAPLRRHFLTGLIAALAVVAAVMSSAVAQQPQPPKQIPLTAKQIESFIAVVKPMSDLIEKIESGGGNPSPQQIASLSALAKKHGFKDF